MPGSCITDITLATKLLDSDSDIEPCTPPRICAHRSYVQGSGARLGRVRGKVSSNSGSQRGKVSSNLPEDLIIPSTQGDVFFPVGGCVACWRRRCVACRGLLRGLRDPRASDIPFTYICDFGVNWYVDFTPTTPATPGRS